MKKFLSGSSLWSKTSLSQPECPVDKGALELPPGKNNTDSSGTSG